MPRRGGMRATINTVKHYVHHTNTVIATGAISNQNICVAVVAPAVASAATVREGAVVKAIYIERWLIGDASSGTSSQFTLVIEKKRTAEPDMTHAQSQNLGSYPNKKNILYTTQGVLGSKTDGAQALPIFRQWIMIPKGKQRFGAGDELLVNIAAVTAIRNCGIDTYKEYV